MAKRGPRDDKLIQMGFRVSESLKLEIDAAADEAKLSSNSWLLLAAEEKLERDQKGGSGISDDELRETIKSVVEEMLEEKKGGK